MKVKVSPVAVKGHVIAPASKSVMQRLLAAALLHSGVTEISNPGRSNDDLAALGIVQVLGATSEMKDDRLIISSNDFPKASSRPLSISCGESGLSARMFAPIVALADNKITLTAEGSLRERPMQFFEHIFPELSIDIRSNAGKFPLQIQGPLQPKDIRVDGSLSSQFLTGLLFAYGAAAKEAVTISVHDLKSKPYIDLTLKVMTAFGYRVVRNDYTAFTVHPLVRTKDTIRYAVEGDWSNAAFLLVAGAIGGSISISGLQEDSPQADKAILQVLKQCGAGLAWSSDQLTVVKDQLLPFEFDATHCPDLFPPLVALAAYCKGSSVIKGVSRLAGKESDRAKTLSDNFGNMGIAIVIRGDEMKITGGTVNGATVSSHQDHRIAMAAAIAALGARGPVTIEHAEAVNKSYPGFFRDLEIAGATTEAIET